MSNDNHNPPSKVSAAFVEAWSTIRTLGHDSNNPHFRNKYTSYDKIMQAIRPILAERKLAIIQPPMEAGNRAALRTLLIHEDGGQLDLGTIAVPVKKDDDPQAFGSAMTYAKRYALCAALGIPTGEDDDGNAAAEQPKQDTKAAAMGAISSWAGVAGSDLANAALKVMQWAGVEKGDPDAPAKVVAYVEKHKQEDFIEHSKGKDS